MDAGKFNLSFGNISGPGANRFKGQLPAESPALPKDPEVQTPQDQVSFKAIDETPSGHLEAFTPASSVPTETLSTDLGFVAGPNSTSSSQPTFSPSGILDLNSLGSLTNQGLLSTGGGLTALNTIGSTSFHSVSGVTRASLNVLSPVASPRMPSTSVSTHGIEDTAFITSSGRVISADSKPVVKMPTTSVSTFGLDSDHFVTTSGRLIAL